MISFLKIAGYVLISTLIASAISAIVWANPSPHVVHEMGSKLGVAAFTFGIVECIGLFSFGLLFASER